MSEFLDKLKTDEFKMASQSEMSNNAGTADMSTGLKLSGHVGVTGNILKDYYALEDSEDAEDEAKFLLANGKSPTLRSSAMQKFFAGTHMLITGGTGFLGKVLIEKLLRTCPDIETVYMIVRPKKGKDQATRLNDMFDDVLFSRLRTENPNFHKKVIPLAGDFALEGLGLSDEDRKTIIDKVSIIIHGAATVRFDERLSTAVAINVRGTYDILALARRCQLLKSFTHISTAFANCNERDVEEKFYNPPMDYKSIMALISLEDKYVEDMTPKILGKFPNTYTYTKSISEDTVRQFAAGMPVSVVRPSIVISTYEEPIRGWTDNLYGPTGVVVGCGTGVLRTLHLDTECKAELVPVDLTVNCILAATWDTSVHFKENQTSDIPIYHFVSGQQMPLTWGTFTELNQRYGEDKPTVQAVWYYGFTPQKYRSVYLLFAFFLHFIPALIADAVLSVIGKKRMMLKAYRKIAKFNNCLSFFTTQNWHFRDTSMTKLWNRLDGMDKTLFPFDLTKLSWEYHSETHILGLRVYLLKENLSTLPEAKIKWRRLYYLHQIVKVVFYFFVANLLWALSKFFVNLIY